MINKCWVKVRDSKKGSVFRNGKNEVFIHKTALGYYFIGKRTTEDMSFKSLNPSPTGEPITQKSKALKVLNKYMKENC